MLLLALGVVLEAVQLSSVGLSRRELRANATRIAEGNWAAEAVRSAIDSMDVTLVAATTS